jgi:hypothetical protein
MGTSEIVTPDGLSEAGKKFIEQKLAGKYSPEDVKTIKDTLDMASRGALMQRGTGEKLADAFKRSIPLASSTAEKMSEAYAQLFQKEIPEDVKALVASIQEISGKKFN